MITQDRLLPHQGVLPPRVSIKGLKYLSIKEYLTSPPKRSMAETAEAGGEVYCLRKGTHSRQVIMNTSGHWLTHRAGISLFLLLVLLFSGPFGSPGPAQASSPALVEPGKPLQFDYVFDMETRTAQAALHGKDGFIWIGGDAGSGLFRWDGYELKVYEAGPDALSSGSIYRIIEDPEDAGILWLATAGGLNRFDRRTESVTHYMHHPEKPDGLLSNTLYHMAQDAFDADIIWIGSPKGLSKFSKTKGVIANYTHDPDAPDCKKNISPKTVWRILPDPNDPNTLWIGFWGTGMDKFNIRKEEFTHFRYDPDDPDSFGCPDNVAHSMTQDKDDPNIIWIGTRTCGLEKFDKTAEKFIHYSHKTHASLPDKIGIIHDDGHGVLWMGGWSKKSGLTLFDKKNETFATYKQTENDPRSLADNAVVNVFQDRDDRVWVVNHNGKINKYDTYTQNFKLYASGQTVTTLSEDRNKNIWIGTREGLNRFNPATGESVTFQSGPDGLDGNYIASVHEAAPGQVWVSVWFGLFNLMDTETGNVIKRYGPEQGNKAEAYSDMIQDPDNPDIIWLAGRGPEAGFTKFDKRSERFSYFLPNTQNPEKGTIVRDTYKVHHDSAGPVIWTAGWSGGGLNRFDKNSERFTHYLNNPDDPDSLAHDSIAEIFQDRNGTIWIGTLGKGLDKYHKENGKFEHFFTDHGIPSNVFGIAEDDAGNLWLSTNKGILRFNPEDGVMENRYTASDGLQGDTFVAGSVLETSGGEIWFGGTKGVNSFHPGQFTTNTTAPPIILLSLTRAGEKIAPENTDPMRMDEIVLDWQHNYFEFEYTAINFTAPEKNQYKYMLEGWDQTWYQAGTERKGRYSGLTGGDYTLRVIGANNDGVWNEEGVSLKVTVTPAFWQTWWFRISAVLLLFFLAAGGAVWRLRSVEIQRRKLKELVNSRTKDLQVAKERADAASRAKSDFLSNMSHELRTPLHAILGYTQILNQQEITSSKNKDCITIIEKSSEHLLTLINDILDIAKIEAGKVELSPEPLDLVTLLNNVVNMVIGRAEIKGIDLTYENRCQVPVCVVVDGTRLQQVVLNLLGNAIKFTEHGGVTLTVELMDPPDENTVPEAYAVRFTVSDTGIGIAPEMQERIFLPFEQSGSRTTNLVEGTGLGLTISQQIVKLMGGEIQLQSQAGRGSTFFFDLTLPAVDVQTVHLPKHERRPLGYEGERLRALVADDAEYNRHLLKEMLEPLGFEVLTAGDGQQAIETALTQRPDVILIDLVMPVKTGVAAIQELRKYDFMKETLIICISASVLEADKKSGLEAGSNVFLPKPLRQDALFSVLEERLPIKWQYEPIEPEEFELPADVLTELTDLMRSGRIRKFRERLDALENESEDYQPVIQNFQRLARRYEIKEIMLMLDSYAKKDYSVIQKAQVKKAPDDFER